MQKMSMVHLNDHIVTSGSNVEVTGGRKRSNRMDYLPPERADFIKGALQVPYVCILGERRYALI